MGTSFITKITSSREVICLTYFFKRYTFLLCVWHTPLILVLGRQRQADLHVFEASLVYIASSNI